jgi:predicted O-methyltransferase YrrM
VIARLVRDGTAVARSDSTLHDLFPVAASAAEGEALRDWILREKATRTVEIGLGYGISALHICEGLLVNSARASRHVVIDPYQATRFSDCGLQFLDEAGVREMVELHAEDSRISLPRFLDEARSFDLAFVDGNHRFDGVFVDLFYLGRLIRPGGIIFLDDYQLPGVARGLIFHVEPGLDHGGDLTPRRPAPVGGTAYLHGSRHATIRPLRRFLKQGYRQQVTGFRKRPDT